MTTTKEDDIYYLKFVIYVIHYHINTRKRFPQDIVDALIEALWEVVKDRKLYLSDTELMTNLLNEVSYATK